MIDLGVAVIAMCAISIAIFFGTTCTLQDARRGWGNFVAFAAVVLLLLAYSLREFHPAILIRLIPSANVVVWGNFSPICVALLAAAAWRTMPGARWQRVLAVSVLTTICLWRSYGFLLRPVPSLQSARWTAGVCRQSTKSTCSAAAAATLLVTVGVKTDEAEMSRLCLTREEGTDSYGLYRGLKLKDPHAKYFTGSADEFLQLDESAVITIGLEDKSRGTVDFPVSHSVVFFGETPDGKVDLGDPYSGRQTWTANQLRAVWRNEAIVVPRQTSH